MTGPNKFVGVQNVIEKNKIIKINRMDFVGNIPMFHYFASIKV